MFIGIAGKIASGKSTLARAIAPRLNARRLGFGDYVRSIAEARGLNSSNRTILQALGHDLATRDPGAFVRGILSFAGYLPPENIVFDGIRHEAIWKEIRTVAAGTHDVALLVFLEVPEEMRLRRLVARGFDDRNAHAFDEHASESDLKEYLPKTADLTLDVDVGEEQLVEKVVRFAEKT